MGLSDLSIKRPVVASVISLLVAIFGLFSFDRLAVREYPDNDPPFVSIVTTYRGASADVVETQITRTIEDSIVGIDGIRTVTSASRDGSSSISIEFKLERDIDAAANDVRDKVARIAGRLPAAADAPVISKAETDARPFMSYSLRSETWDQMQLTDYVQRNVIDRLSTIKGVANVRISGERRYSMRVWLDRRALAARELTPGDVEEALRRQNVELPSGRIESTTREFSVRTDATLRTAESFGAIVLKNAKGFPVRLADVAKVEVGPESLRGETRANFGPAIGIAIIKQSKANTLEVAHLVHAEMDAIKPSLPGEVALEMSFDNSIFIDRSIYEVYHALGTALVLVILVIYVFLRSWRAVLVPAVAIPVSVMGAVIVLAVAGFSINVLTLLAFVLAIGLVVDDAIVVLENIHRRIEEGETPLLAAVRGSRQIGFAVMATTTVLIAVFVPIAFVEGAIGRIFTEFGITVAGAVLFSGLVALTLTPMMCSKLLRPHSAEGPVYQLTEPYFEKMTVLYARWLDWALARPRRVVLAAGASIALSAVLLALLPAEFAPTEDRANISVSITLPEGASLGETKAKLLEVENMLRPYVEKGEIARSFGSIAASFDRPGDVNEAQMWLRLPPWSERDRSQMEIVEELNQKLRAMPGARAAAINQSSLSGGHGGFGSVQLIIGGGGSFEELIQWRDLMEERLRREPKLTFVRNNLDTSKPEVRLTIDRNRAADLGVGIDDIGRTLEIMMGGRLASTFTDRGEEYNVILQARDEDRARPSDLTNIFVRSRSSGELVPLAALVSVAEQGAISVLRRADRMRAYRISAQPAPGVELGEAVDALEKAVRDTLPPQARMIWDGESRDYKEGTGALYFTFGLALLVVFLVLAAQFESFLHPAIILLTVPLAVTGALLTLFLTGKTVNIYSQIGVIMLIGISAKNGILIVEFANQLRAEGKAILDATREAAAARLRPILMTSIATAIGAVPLAIATGAGAETRSAVGVVIVGGTLFSTLTTLFVIPVFYRALAGRTKAINHVAERIVRLEREERLAAGGAAD